MKTTTAKDPKINWCKRVSTSIATAEKTEMDIMWDHIHRLQHDMGRLEDRLAQLGNTQRKPTGP